MSACPRGLAAKLSGSSLAHWPSCLLPEVSVQIFCLFGKLGWSLLSFESSSSTLGARHFSAICKPDSRLLSVCAVWGPHPTLRLGVLCPVGLFPLSLCSVGRRVLRGRSGGGGGCSDPGRGHFCEAPRPWRQDGPPGIQRSLLLTRDREGGVGCWPCDPTRSTEGGDHVSPGLACPLSSWDEGLPPREAGGRSQPSQAPLHALRRGNRGPARRAPSPSPVWVPLMELSLDDSFQTK